MERLTYVTENGEVLFHPADLPDDEGMTITQLAENGRYKDLEEIAERLANRGQAEEQGLPIRWIPCSERLPETSGYYLACVYDSDVDDFDFRKNWFAHKDDYDMDESEWRELQPFEVVTGWMPLPKPYRESEE